MDECFICSKFKENGADTKTENGKCLFIWNEWFDENDLKQCLCTAICKYYFVEDEDEPTCWYCTNYYGSNYPKNYKITEDERYNLISSDQEKPLIGNYNLESIRENYKEKNNIL